MITLIEATVISYLSRALESDNVYAERPVNLPDEYYIVEKTGGDEENHINTALIAIQCVSSVSLLNAAMMCHLVETAMKSFISESNVSKCKLNSSYNFTDTASKQYRYQAVYDITYMEGE